MAFYSSFLRPLPFLGSIERAAKKKEKKIHHQIQQFSVTVAERPGTVSLASSSDAGCLTTPLAGSRLGIPGSLRSVNRKAFAKVCHPDMRGNVVWPTLYGLGGQEADGGPDEIPETRAWLVELARECCPMVTSRVL